MGWRWASYVVAWATKTIVASGMPNESASNGLARRARVCCTTLAIAQPVKTKDKKGLTLIGQPVSLSRTPSKLVAPPPGLGQHTDAVLKEFGFSARQIATLRQVNAI